MRFDFSDILADCGCPKVAMIIVTDKNMLFVSDRQTHPVTLDGELFLPARADEFPDESYECFSHLLVLNLGRIEDSEDLAGELNPLVSRKGSSQGVKSLGRHNIGKQSRSSLSEYMRTSLMDDRGDRPAQRCPLLGISIG